MTRGENTSEMEKRLVYVAAWLGDRTQFLLKHESRGCYEGIL